MTPAGSEAGFSLIEALVALLVLGIAAAGLVRAAEAYIDSIRNVERRATAQFVAQNRLAEIAIGDPAMPKTVPMLAETWRITTREQRTSDPDIAKVTVAVSGAKDDAALISLDGFRDLGSTTR